MKAPQVAACTILLSFLMMLAQPTTAAVDAAGAQHLPAMGSTTSSVPGSSGADIEGQPDADTTDTEPETSSAPLALAALGAVVVMVAVLAFTYRRFRSDA